MALGFPSVAGALVPQSMPHPFHYGMFGNDVVDDCSEVASANLTIHEFHDARITTAQVETAWQLTQGWTDAANTYMETTGFGGHTIKAVIPVTTQAQMIHYANEGGVWAEFFGPSLAAPQWMHDVAVIGANASQITYVTGGEVVSESWAQWDTRFTFTNGNIVDYAYAYIWN